MKCFHKPPENEMDYNQAIDDFALAMKEAMRQAEEDGKYGWDDIHDFPTTEATNSFLRQIANGHCVDAANYLMMVFTRGGVLQYEHRKVTMALGLQMLVELCHTNSYNAGWWHVKLPDGTVIDMKNSPDHPFYPYFVATKMMLTVSETSEGMEGFRRGLQDDKLPQFTMEQTEAVDELIRIFDKVGARGYDIIEPFFAKTAYNTVRPDHKIEARMGVGGKKF